MFQTASFEFEAMGNSGFGESEANNKFFVTGSGSKL